MELKRSEPARSASCNFRCNFPLQRMSCPARATSRPQGDCAKRWLGERREPNQRGSDTVSQFLQVSLPPSAISRNRDHGDIAVSRTAFSRDESRFFVLAPPEA